MKTINMNLLIILSVLAVFGGCGKRGRTGADPAPPLQSQGPSDVSFWLTTSNQSSLLQKQNTTLVFGTVSNGNPAIVVDSTQRFQVMDGFGFTLTGGSAEVIMALPENVRSNLLNELFSTTAAQSIGISYLRLSMGASDLSSSVFSYDDLPAGQTDPALQHFNLSKDTVELIPLLRQILQVNPGVKIISTPWSAPLWMKTNNSSVGGKLMTQYYSVYAQYFVRYIKAMKARGITIDAVTPQNEPLHGGNNPSMEMTAQEQADFIKNHLGPAFQAAGLNTKIIIYDHNADRPDYPLAILNDPVARQFIDGSAFHLYGGDINALSQVHQAHRDKNIYFTEQYTSSTGNFGGDLSWHVRNLIVGAIRNWSRNVLEWNLANNTSFGPHTNGGCTSCKGALTIGTGITRNVSYYIIAHASRFVPPGSVRIGSNALPGFANVAFQTPEGKKVLIVLNDSSTYQYFNIKFRDKWISAVLDAGSVGTYVW